MTALFLNSISGGEIMVVLLIVLMVFGADSIPSLARNMGRGVRQLKDATQDIQRDIANSAKESTSEIKEIAKEIEGTVDKNKFKL
jgi:sec-independent protein translocase protein TatA